jgi:hypothetical protein
MLLEQFLPSGALDRSFGAGGVSLGFAQQAPHAFDLARAPGNSSTLVLGSIFDSELVLGRYGP